jgi:penicillin-binding protein 1A
VQLTIKCPCKGGVYVLHNAGDGEGGRSYTLRNALANSINTVYVPLANKVGRGKVARLAERAGLAPLPPDKRSLEGRPGAPANFQSFGIGGGADVTPLSEAVAYGTIANGGVHVSPRAFTEIRTGAAGTNPGQVLFTTKPSGLSRVVSSKVADEVVKALKDVVAYGTATSVQAAGVPVFGKTGTTNNSTDAWFTGCVPSMHVCIASWMGYEYTSCTLGSGKDLQHVDGSCGGMHDLGGVKGQIYGGTLPARIFTRALQIYSDIKKTEALKAAGVDVTPSASPTPRVRSTHRGTPRTTVAPSRTAAPKPTTVKPSPTPKPVRTTQPPIIVPPTQPPPQPSPSPT